MTDAYRVDADCASGLHSGAVGPLTGFWMEIGFSVSTTKAQRQSSLERLVHTAEGCRVCADELGHEPRPLLRLSPRSRVVIIGQAPGAKVHASGVPWDDASGDHLREWLGVDRAAFYDVDRFGILPMGLCFPGRAPGGDRPPRPICAPLWHDRLLAELDEVRLVLVVGQVAVGRYLPEARGSLTETVRAFATYGPDLFPLPHPSWRSRLWMARHPWFESEVLPALRAAVGAALLD